MMPLVFWAIARHLESRNIAEDTLTSHETVILDDLLDSHREFTLQRLREGFAAHSKMLRSLKGNECPSSSLHVSAMDVWQSRN